MTYIVTIFDATSTKENPVAPINCVVTSDKLPVFISEKVDENHSILIAPIDSCL